MGITKFKSKIFWALVILGFFALILVIVFSILYKKQFMPIAGNVVGQTVVTDSGEILYFTRNDFSVVAQKYSKNSKIETLFTIPGEFSFISASWSPDFSRVAVALSKLSTSSESDLHNKIFYIMDTEKGEKVYSSNSCPDSYIMTGQNEVLGYFSDPDDWTKPGLFKNINISATTKLTNIVSYETTGTLLLYKDGVDLVFADIDQDSVEGSRSIKSLDLNNKKITEITEVEGLIDAKYIGNKQLLLTRFVSGRTNVYLKDLNKKDDVLLSTNNYNERVTLYKDRAIGFAAQGYTYGEQREGSENSTTIKDSFIFMDNTESNIFNKQIFVDCQSPNIGSRYSASFVCGSTLYKAKGKLF